MCLENSHLKGHGKQVRAAYCAKPPQAAPCQDEHTTGLAPPHPHTPHATYATPTLRTTQAPRTDSQGTLNTHCTQDTPTPTAHTVHHTHHAHVHTHAPYTRMQPVGGVACDHTCTVGLGLQALGLS